MKLLTITLLVAALVSVSFATAVQEPPKVDRAKQMKNTQILSYEVGKYIQAHPELAEDVQKSIWGWIKCHICTEVISHMIDFVVDHGCDLADPVAAAACAIAGPCEPLCAAALIEGCSIIVEDVVHKHITDHKRICKDIHMC